MRGEYPSPQPASSSEEIKDNVVPFPVREKPAEHAVEHIMGEAGTHKRSMYHLSELGYASLEEAQTGLAELRKEKSEILENLNKHVMFSAVGKFKDKVFNQGREVNKLTEVEGKLHQLEIAVRFTKATEHLADDEASQEQNQAGREFKKAA